MPSTRANPNPALITRIQFLPITPPATSYDIDVVVDDLALVPLAPDSGTDTAVDAPADGGAQTDTSVSDASGTDGAGADDAAADGGGQ